MEQEDIERIIRQRVKQARLDAGLNQKELADLLGFGSHATVSRYEKGTLDISADVLFCISKVTRKPISFFFNDDKPIETDIQKAYLALNDKGRQRLLEYLQELALLYSR